MKQLRKKASRVLVELGCAIPFFIPIIFFINLLIENPDKGQNNEPPQHIKEEFIDITNALHKDKYFLRETVVEDADSVIHVNEYCPKLDEHNKNRIYMVSHKINELDSAMTYKICMYCFDDSAQYALYDKILRENKK